MNKPYDRKLTGNRCQCQSCFEYFNSTYAFDKHRTGLYSARRCLSVQEMLKEGMGLNADNWWISERMQPSKRVPATLGPVYAEVG